MIERHIKLIRAAFIVASIALGVSVFGLFGSFADNAEKQYEFESNRPRPDMVKTRLHDNITLNNLLWSLQNVFSFEKVKECHEMLLVEATDPADPYDQIAWVMLYARIMRHMGTIQRQMELWEWFQNEVVDESNKMFESELVRGGAIGTYRMVGVAAPDWLFQTEHDQSVWDNNLVRAQITPVVTSAPADTEEKPGEGGN